MIINNKEYKLIIERKRIKNIYLRVDQDKLLITCPLYVSNKEIENFINSRINWIVKTLNKKTINSKLIIGNTIFYKGKEYNFVILKGNKSLNIDNDTIYIRCRSGEMIDAINTFYELSKKILLNDIYRLDGEYIDILNDYGYHLKPIYNIKKLKSMWGVCYSKKNIVNISCRLIHFEDECLKAVLWHELCHFIMPNHSDRFYKVIQNHMPNYKEIIKKLK